MARCIVALIGIIGVSVAMTTRPIPACGGEGEAAKKELRALSSSGGTAGMAGRRGAVRVTDLASPARLLRPYELPSGLPTKWQRNSRRAARARVPAVAKQPASSNP
jgi:hypothetical protein